MFINFTMHALARIRQRGKSTEGVKMVLRHGTNRGHSSRVMFKKDSLREIERRQQWLKRLSGSRAKTYSRAMKKRIYALEKMRGCVVVVKNNSVLTTYNETQRKAKKRYRRRRKWM
ncbi:MAG: hypothetical protein R1F54_03830 [Candidatus Zeuxoniibacter abyssi]|nr:MAG: hypothetical protein R1F54_03830 [Candidatus Persebacteraceae bacterium AB1(2)]